MGNDVKANMGGLVFAEGSAAVHLSQDDVGNTKTDNLDKALAKYSNFIQPRHLHAGDASCHKSWTLHSAPDNDGDAVRKAIAITLVCDGSKIGTREQLKERGKDDVHDV